MVICSKWVVSQEKLAIKTGNRGKIKEDEIISWGNATLKRITSQIVVEFFEIERRTKKEVCFTIRKRKDWDIEKDKVIEVAIGKETEVINLKEKVKTKRRH